MTIFSLEKKENRVEPRLTKNGLELREGAHANDIGEPPVTSAGSLENILSRTAWRGYYVLCWQWWKPTLPLEPTETTWDSGA